MKKLIFFFLFSPLFIYAQDTTRVYEMAQQMPHFNGDIPSYISEHFVYPPQTMSKGIQGSLVIGFIVEKDGSLSGAYPMKSLEHSIDSSAIACIYSMPKWTPGALNGVIVRVKYAIPIRVSAPVIDSVSVNPSTPPRIK
jgi:Gram-negative bacterial TonB protein C-terminal